MMDWIRLAKAVSIVGLVAVGIVFLVWLLWATQGKAYWLILLGPIILGVAMVYFTLGKDE